MVSVFLKILNMSISAGWIILAIIILRPLLKKSPKSIGVCLWGIVGIRLIFPFSFESVLSLLPSAETISYNAVSNKTLVIESGVGTINNAINSLLSNSKILNELEQDTIIPDILLCLSLIWIAGATIMIGYTVISYLMIRKNTKEAILFEDNIYFCDNADTPFILGIVKPKIYLPSSIEANDIPYVTAHERAHLGRLDHIWKPLGFTMLSIYWFSPLMWIAYILLCRDIELACDQKVLLQMGLEHKKPYSLALINSSSPKKRISACPIAFGEIGIKNRIKSILNYKKPALWLIITAVTAVVVIGVCFLTNPLTKEKNIYFDIDSILQIQSGKEAYFVEENRLYKQTEQNLSILAEEDTNILGIILNNDKIYYYTTPGGGHSEIFLISTDGTNKEKVINTLDILGQDAYCPILSWQIGGNYIYMQFTFHFYRMNINTLEYELLSDDVGIYQIYSDNLWYIDHANETFTIYKMNLDSQKTEIILGNGKTRPNSDLYSNFVIANDGSLIYTKRVPYELGIFKDGKHIVIDSGENIVEQSLVCYENHVYYIKKEENISKLFCYSLSNGNIKEVAVVNDYNGEASIYGEYYFYLNESGEIVKIPLNKRRAAAGRYLLS